MCPSNDIIIVEYESWYFLSADVCVFDNDITEIRQLLLLSTISMGGNFTENMFTVIFSFLNSIITLMNYSKVD